MREILGELNVEDTPADWSADQFRFEPAPIVVKPVRQLLASDLDIHINKGLYEENDQDGDLAYLDHHDRMMRATEHLREKASWKKRTERTRSSDPK